MLVHLMPSVVWRPGLGKTARDNTTVAEASAQNDAMNP